MVRRAALLIVVLVLGSAASAQGHTTIIEPIGSHFPYQRWIDETTRVPTPDVTITVIEHTDQPGDCGKSGLGCTDGESLWIASWLTTSTKYTFFHELGHVFALLHPDLAAFEDERFADIYSLCARLKRITPRSLNGAGEGMIAGTRLQWFCQRIRQAG